MALNDKSDKIYALVDPRTEQVRYVGCTSNPVERLTRHCHKMYSTEQCHAWLQDLERGGLVAEVRILEDVVPEHSSYAREQWWIAKGLERGWDLLNQHISIRTDGYAPQLQLTHDELQSLKMVCWKHGKRVADVAKTLLLKYLEDAS